jgi:predicted kinase
MLLKSVIDLQVAYHLRLLEMRRLERLLSSESFISLWESASKDTKAKVVKAIRRGKISRIQAILDKELTVSELRQLASNYQIKNYSRKPRSILLEEVNNARARCENINRKFALQNERSASSSRCAD